MPDSLVKPTPAVAAWPVVVWLSACCLLVFCMVLLGGAVRLTGAGLSMVDWQPLRGAILPLGHAQWLRAFEQYQQFPEFKLINADITLARFQFLFLMEYAHRLLGRVTGLVFLLPFLFFLMRRMVPREMVGRLWLLFLLGGMQGLLGWYLVKSGLADDPRVSHYRLAMHFMLAVVIYAYMLRVVVGLYQRRVADQSAYQFAAPQTITTTAGAVALAVILLMMASGALVAGTHAGHSHNTWPKMGGLWLPQQLLAMQPWWLNFFENTVAIQFVHRWLASVALLAVGYFAYRLRHDEVGRDNFRRADADANTGQWSIGYLMLAVVSAQVMLGIATLVWRVPVALGVAHQAGAMVLLSVVVVALAMRIR